MNKKPNPFIDPMRHFRTRFVISRARDLFYHPLFWFLTVAANGSMLAGALSVHWLEHDTNPEMNSFLNALWWSVSTVTTVGYGDITPQSVPGRVIGMFLMIFGTAVFGAFTALFAAVLLESDLNEVENEMHELQKSANRRRRRR